jgi:hypothetical protein
LERTLPGLAITILAGAAVEIVVFGTAAVNCVALTYFVVSGDKFHSTCEDGTKFIPFTVSVNAVPPGIHVEGIRVPVTGVGSPKYTVRALLVDATLWLSGTYRAVKVCVPPASPHAVKVQAFAA